MEVLLQEHDIRAVRAGHLSNPPEPLRELLAMH
jgi:hypothetical protein